MVRLLWMLSVTTRYYLRSFTPTNWLVGAIRSRRGLKWGVPAMLLAVPYLYTAGYLTVLIEEGAPDWLHLLVLLCRWNVFKMLWIGPVSLVQLLHVRGAERQMLATNGQRMSVAPGIL